MGGRFSSMPEHEFVQFTLTHKQAEVLKAIFTVGAGVMGLMDGVKPEEAFRTAPYIGQYINRKPEVSDAYGSLADTLNIMRQVVR